MTEFSASKPVTFKLKTLNRIEVFQRRRADNTKTSFSEIVDFLVNQALDDIENVSKNGGIQSANRYF